MRKAAPKKPDRQLPLFQHAFLPRKAKPGGKRTRSSKQEPEEAPLAFQKTMGTVLEDPRFKVIDKADRVLKELYEQKLAGVRRGNLRAPGTKIDQVEEKLREVVFLSIATRSLMSKEVISRFESVLNPKRTKSITREAAASYYDTAAKRELDKLAKKPWPRDYAGRVDLAAEIYRLMLITNRHLGETVERRVLKTLGKGRRAIIDNDVINLMVKDAKKVIAEHGTR